MQKAWQDASIIAHAHILPIDLQGTVIAL
jgi:hypothetical protein